MKHYVLFTSKEAQAYRRRRRELTLGILALISAFILYFVIDFLGP